jgi:DMSO reductase family type II enzyme heme b subunit
MLVRLLRAPPEALRDPEGRAWPALPAEEVELVGTPVDRQPTRHIRRSLALRPPPKQKSLRLQAAHDGERIYFRLEWPDESVNSRHEEDLFPDAAALLFPVHRDAPLETMGSQAEPVNAWFWRPDLEACPEDLLAQGIGTLERQDAAGLEAVSSRGGETWRLVLSRPLSNGGSSSGVGLRPGGKTKVAVAVWDGAAGERAGIKAYSQTWRELELEPVGGAP